MKEPVFGKNANQSYIDFETTEGKLRFGKEDLKLFIEFNGTKIYLTEDDGSLNVETSDLGAAATPVARTNNPIVGANKPNLNIDALDAAIGADIVPGTRTTGQLSMAATILANLKLIDDVIGFDAQMPVSSLDVSRALTIYQNLRALDSKKTLRTVKFRVGMGGLKAAGTLTVAGTPVADQTMNIGAVTYTFKALRAVAGEITIDADNAVQVTNIVNAITADSTDVTAVDGAGNTVVVTAVTAGVAGSLLDFYTNATGITMDGAENLQGTVSGVDPVAGCDFHFAPNANHAEQSIDLGAILPAKCRLADLMVYTDAAFTSLGVIATDLGLTTGAGDLIGAGNNAAIDSILAAANAGAFIATPSKDAQHIWLNVDPANNWDSANPVGRMTVYVSFIDVTNV